MSTVLNVRYGDVQIVNAFAEFAGNGCFDVVVHAAYKGRDRVVRATITNWAIIDAALSVPDDDKYASLCGIVDYIVVPVLSDWVFDINVELKIKN